MALKLRVISDQYRMLGKQSSRLFGVHGGRIGRAPDNDWVLPDADRYVSAHHARVLFKAGAWVLEDTSTNGVFVNGSDTPLAIVGNHVLKDGDRLRLGDYEVLVSIDERNDFPAEASGQVPIPTTLRKKPKPAAIEDLGEDLDLGSLLLDDVPAPSRSPSSVFELPNAYGVDVPAAPGKPTSLLDAPDEGPQRTVVHGKDSAEWAMATRPLKRSTPATAFAGARAESANIARSPGGIKELDAGVEALCRGIGIDPATVPTDGQAAMLTLAGQMLREVVLSLMDALKSRADLKNQLRLNQTTIQPAENNPLKFSASVDEALRKLLDGHNNRYLGPIEAIRDSFGDLKAHQSAIDAAMKAAVDTLLERLEPGELQERFDRSLKRGALLGATNKMKYWDLYTEFYQVLNQRDGAGLPAVFSDEFARAYMDHDDSPNAGRKRG